MREKSLFNNISSHEYVRRVPLKVAEEMARWKDEIFDNAALLDPKVLELKKQAEVKPVILKFEQRTGKRRQETKSGDDGWGRQVDRTYEVIDVSVPFEGDNVCFTISPSTKTLGTGGVVSGNHLIITLMDDERLEGALESQVETIRDNLARVAADLTHLPQAVDQTIEREIKRRQEANQARRDRDSNRSFPIA